MHIEFRSVLRCTPEALFAFHERPDAINLLTQPGAGVRVISAAPSLKAGSEARLSIPLLGPIRKEWLARHVVYEPPHRFVDEQLRGPFRRWRHEHRVEPHVLGAELIDAIDLELPLGLLGTILGGWYVRRMLATMFRFRHEVTRSFVESGK